MREAGADAADYRRSYNAAPHNDKRNARNIWRHICAVGWRHQQRIGGDYGILAENRQRRLISCLHLVIIVGR